jgi:hypothetical protein
MRPTWFNRREALSSIRTSRFPAALLCVAVAVLASTSAASPATGRANRASFTVAITPVLPPAITGVLYPPKPFSAVGFCRPVLKFGRSCGDYTFKLSAKGGSLPAGMSIDRQSGAVVGLPRGRADTYQPPGSKTPGLYQFAVCVVSKKGTICKPSQLVVFSAFGGTWKGSFQGDSGAFTCNTPLSGDITLSLTQKATIVKGVPVSTVGGTAELTNLPPISAVENWDGTQTGPCTTSTQKFGFGPGKIANPTVGGPDSVNGVWNLQLAPDGSLTGSLTIQDAAKNGFFSELAFTATH